MDKQIAEQFKLYQVFLEAIDGSRLMRNMSIKDKNLIKIKYIHASVNDISFAIDEIKKQEEAFLKNEMNVVSKLDSSMKNMNEAIAKGEEYLATK